MLLLEGGRVLCPDGGIDALHDVLIDDGQIVALLRPGEGPADVPRFPCHGRCIAPAFVDLAAQLGDPGFPWREDLASGSRAGAAGGFATLISSPATLPVLDRGAIVDHLVQRGRVAPGARVGVAGALTVGGLGQELAELGALAAAGAVAYSDGGAPVADAGVLRRALEYARPFGLPVIVRPGDPSLEQHGVMHEGVVSLSVGLRGVPEAAEEVGVTRVLALARATGARVHLSHVTTARAVAVLRAARAEGLPFTAAVPARHLLLTDAAVADSGYETRFRLMPPLRPERDRLALVKAVEDGVVDVVSPDHVPLGRVEKELEFQVAEPGAVGLESAFSATYTALAGDLEKTVRRLSLGPAAALGLRPRVCPGAPADLVVLDTDWVGVFGAPIWSKGRAEPLQGLPGRGRVVATFVGGRLAFDAAGR